MGRRDVSFTSHFSFRQWKHGVSDCLDTLDERRLEVSSGIKFHTELALPCVGVRLAVPCTHLVITHYGRIAGRQDPTHRHINYHCKRGKVVKKAGPKNRLSLSTFSAKVSCSEVEDDKDDPGKTPR